MALLTDIEWLCLVTDIELIATIISLVYDIRFVIYTLDLGV